MYKIALCGRAGTGKNTVADMFKKLLFGEEDVSVDQFAFADPIKEIVKTMFPHVKKEHLYGPSHFRNEVIRGAKDANGNPLTIRQALLDIGTSVGRAYNDKLWLENMEYRIDDAKYRKSEMVIITDVRFRNEFDWLRDQHFYMINIVRNNLIKINHISEQGLIDEMEYSTTIDNNGTMSELEERIKKIIPALHY